LVERDIVFKRRGRANKERYERELIYKCLEFVLMLCWNEWISIFVEVVIIIHSINNMVVTIKKYKNFKCE